MQDTQQHSGCSPASTNARDMLLPRPCRSRTVQQDCVLDPFRCCSDVCVVAIAAAAPQIPLRLCKSLVRALRHFGNSSSCRWPSDDSLTTTYDHKYEMMLSFTSIALMLLSHNAMELAVPEAACKPCSSAAADVPPRVTAGFAQQLERSEMLLCLPEMLKAAAHTLARYTRQVWGVANH